MPIRFGTDGWRGVIADDFTFDNVRIVAQAIADLIREEGHSVSPVPVGYDGRFLSPRFAEAVAGVLEANGVPTLLPEGPTTTPMVSCQVVAAGAPLGVCVTASHNPAAWNGIKVKAAFGGSALPEVTARIEALLGRRVPRAGRAPDRRHPFMPAYVPRVAAVADLEAIRRTSLRVVVDSMHGAGGTILADLLRRGRARVVTIRGAPDVLFGGIAPEPRPENLGPLRAGVLAHRAHIGIATDGDGDRLGVVDEAGRVLSPFQVFALIAVHLLEGKGWRGGVARTFANTMLAERIARRFRVPFFDVPIGFKHIARLMLDRDVLIGGEESGGIGVKRFLPERDGIVAGLLLLEMLARGPRRLSARVARLEEEYGRYAYRRVDLPMPADRGRRVVDDIRARPPVRLAGLTARGIDTLDGVKVLFGEEGWILFRASGTEPILRIYCEARTATQVGRLIDAGARRVREARPDAAAPPVPLTAGRAPRRRSPASAPPRRRSSPGRR